MTFTKKNCTPFYALIQSLYWTTYCLMGSYASVFLLDRGFSNSQIGLILGFSYSFSAVLQPALAGFFSRMRVRLNSAMVPVYGLIALVSAALLLLPLSKPAIMLLMTLNFTLQSAMQPSVNSLPRGFELSGVPVNFGLARGLGSLVFAVVSTLTGLLMRHAPAAILPGLYLTSSLLLALALALFRVPRSNESAQSAEKLRRAERTPPILRRYPRFGLFLAGIMVLSINHILIDNYMLQIVTAIGGDSVSMGLAVSIPAAVELPAMMLYRPLSRRIDRGLILRIAAVAWLIKNLLLTFAPSPAAIYLIQPLQFFCFALYVPASVDYIAHALPASDYLRGQALAGSAFTLGSVFAAFAGGRMLDLFGVHLTLVYSLGFSVIGVLLFQIAIPRPKRAVQE